MKLIWYILLVPVLLWGCKKNKNGTDDSNNGGGGAGDFSYSVKYDSVVSTAAGGAYHFQFTIKVLGGSIEDNKLVCAAEGLPAAVSVTPGSMTVSNLLGGVFTFDIGALPIGDYPFDLKITSAKYGVQVYGAVLRIVAPPDFAPFLAGTYDGSYDFCPMTPDFSKYESVVATVPDTASLLRISNMHNLGSSVVVRAWISSVVTIPLQPAAGKMIWGSGTYSHDARPGHEGHYLMSITDTFAVGTDTSVCTMHIEH